jgi:hypothetical protein
MGRVRIRSNGLTEAGGWRWLRITEEVLTGDSRRGRHLSYARGKRNTTPGTSLIKLEGVDDTQAAKYVSYS